jgi:GntR family transcriptional regulator, arabinose operon transcriptional repressor
MNALEKLNVDRTSDLPVFRQLERQLADLISRNIFKTREQMPSIPALSEHLGINYQTIRHAYQALAQKGWVCIINGRGTYVAEKNHRQSAKVIGLVNFEPAAAETMTSHSFGSLIHQGIAQEARQRGLESKYFESFHKILLSTPEREIGGYLIGAFKSGTEDMVLECHRLGIRAITLGGEGRLFPQVRTDDQGGIEMLMNHLFKLGHRRIGIFNVLLDNYSARRRFEAYLQYMAARDLDIHPTWICLVPGHLQEQTEYQEKIFQQLFGGSRPPTAILSCGIELTLSLLQVLNRHRVKVPKTVSVCGYDDGKEFSLMSPPVTTVRQPLNEMGRTAVRNLVSLIAGQTVENTILPVELIVRESTGKAPA